MKSGIHVISIIFGIATMLTISACGSDNNNPGSDNNNPNDQIVPCAQCKTFITAVQYTGDLITEEGGGLASGILAADALCMADANYTNDVGGVGTYKALIVDGVNRIACTSANCITGGSAENLNWVLHPSAEYYRSDGTTLVMTTNSNAIHDFSGGDLSASFDTGANNFWTGINPATWIVNRHCSQWTSSSNAGGNANIGDGGRTDFVDLNVIGGGAASCNAQWGGLLCVEQ